SNSQQGMTTGNVHPLDYCDYSSFRDQAAILTENIYFNTSECVNWLGVKSVGTDNQNLLAGLIANCIKRHEYNDARVNKFIEIKSLHTDNDISGLVFMIYK
ncbi:hypothetical protein BgiMline_035222, partial [Biomphalaria glabrata]